MKSVDMDWIERWAKRSNINFSEDGRITLVCDQPLNSQVVVMTESPRTPADLVLLANRMIRIESDDSPGQEHSIQDQTFLFWIRETGFSDESIESIADDAFQALLRGYGQSDGSRGLLFEASETQAAVIFVLIVITFGWDAYLVPLSSTFVCHLSHHGYVGLTARSGETFQHLLVVYLHGVPRLEKMEKRGGNSPER
jgi:hypothetical protein